MRKIDKATFRAELAAQCVSSPQHLAVTCPACGTVQSRELLRREGCPDDEVDLQVGFSCVGRWNGSGAPDPARNMQEKPGCNWTLGGLLSIHSLEVEDDEGRLHPMFEPASPDDARRLEAEMAQ